MRHVEPKIFLLAKPQLNKEEVYEWLEFIGAGEFIIKDSISAAEQLIELAGRRCYMSFEVGLNPNVTKIREDIEKYLDNILSSGHGSVLEHAYFTFAIENVSRVFTGEMNRHRAGMAISEGSMRYIRFNNIPYWVPNSIRMDEEGYGPVYRGMTDLEHKKISTQRIFDIVFKFVEEHYTALVNLWDLDNPDSQFKDKKKITSMLRRIIPMGAASGGIWTGNIRAWRHIFTMRCNEAAEEEIFYVGCMILERMVKECVLLFKDFEFKEGSWVPKYRKV